MAPQQADVAAWVADELARREDVGVGGVRDITQVAVHPDDQQVAATLTFGPGRTSVETVDLASGTRSPLPVTAGSTHSPHWSPTGDRLCVLVEVAPGGAQAVVVGAPGGHVTSDLPGAVELTRWSPDGTRLALVVAEPGAEISDVFGSGRVDGGGASWAPRVSPAGSGRRWLVVWDLDTGTTRTVTELNVWEVSWSSDDALLALVSDGAGEGAWYAAHLALVSAADGTSRAVHTTRVQLAQPSANPSGTAWSVLSGVASDRGLLAGELLVAAGDGGPRPVDTAGAHVTDHVWTGDTGIVFIGMSGLDTVICQWDAATDATVVVWRGTQSSGLHQPEIAAVDGQGPVIVLEHHDLPPTLGRIEGGLFHPVLGIDGPGPRYVVAQTGTTTPMTWTSDDGQQVQGLLTVPDADGPHSLVVNVHGGPIAAWHDGWIGRDTVTSLLVARGHAVLRPNPRGSTGRGAAWAEVVIGDMGGRDVDDLTSGVRQLIDAGVVDPARVGLTGNSYGGFMAAWVPCVSDVFAATVSRSPVTDWRSQHFTSNLAEFDRLMLTGDPMDALSQYSTRSPVVLADRISTPILLTAGALDLACRPSQAEFLHTRLLELGVETQLAIYPEEGHGVRGAEAIADQSARMIGWFDRFMPPNQPQPITEPGESGSTTRSRE